MNLKLPLLALVLLALTVASSGCKIIDHEADRQRLRDDIAAATAAYADLSAYDAALVAELNERPAAGWSFVQPLPQDLDDGIVRDSGAKQFLISDGDPSRAVIARLSFSGTICVVVSEGEALPMHSDLNACYDDLAQDRLDAVERKLLGSGDAQPSAVRIARHTLPRELAPSAAREAVFALEAPSRSGRIFTLTRFSDGTSWRSCESRQGGDYSNCPDVPGSFDLAWPDNAPF